MYFNLIARLQGKMICDVIYVLNLNLRLSFFCNDKSCQVPQQKQKLKTQDSASCNVWIRDYLDTGDTGLTCAEIETELAAMAQNELSVLSVLSVLIVWYDIFVLICK